MANLWSHLFDQSTDTSTIYTALALGAVGGILLPEVSKLTSWIRFYFVGSSKLSRYQHTSSTTTKQDSSKNNRAWALVTGASDGIGYGFVEELASNNFNVILHGRNQSKVDGLIKNLQQKYPEVIFEAFICSAIDRDVWSQLDELVESLRQREIPLTVLINNVGGSPSNVNDFAEFSSYSLENTTNYIDMNVTFPVQITRTLLPMLTNNQPSLIVNMSSFVGVVEAIQMPLLTTYSASKNFNRQFSKVLLAELALHGHNQIDVVSVVTGTVQSGGMKTDTSFFVPSSRTYAASTLKLAGRGREEFVGYWTHSLQFWAITSMPNGLKSRILGNVALQLKKQFDDLALKSK